MEAAATYTATKFTRDGSGFRARVVNLDAGTGKVVAELAELGWFRSTLLGKMAGDKWIAENQAGA